MAYVEEFLYRGRDADHEKDKSATFHVVLGQFVEGPDGAAQLLRTQPLTPAQAEAKGFTLDKILGEIAASATVEQAKEKERADKAELERDVARQDYSEMAAQLQKANEEKQAAVRAAGAMAIDLQNSADRELALAKRVDELTAEPEGPSNPMLNKLTFGLLGN